MTAAFVFSATAAISGLWLGLVSVITILFPGLVRTGLSVRRRLPVEARAIGLLAVGLFLVGESC